MAAKKLDCLLIYILFTSCNIVTAQVPKLMLPIGHARSVEYGQFSPDGKLVVTCADDQTAKIWDVATGTLLADLTGHTNKVWYALFSPDGKKIVTSSRDKTAKVWDAVSGKKKMTLSPFLRFLLIISLKELPILASVAFSFTNSITLVGSKAIPFLLTR